MVVPEGQLPSIRGVDITVGWIGFPRRQFPVFGAHYDPWIVSVLYKFDTAIVIPMRMTDDDVLDIGRIEAHLLQAIHNFVLCGVAVQGIDQNDPG